MKSVMPLSSRIFTALGIFVAVGSHLADYRQGNAPWSATPVSKIALPARGEGAAAIPGLAGQHKDYLAVQLAAYASGSRENAIMNLIAKTMTPEDIDDVSAYLSSW